MYLLTHMLQKNNSGKKAATIAAEGGSIGMEGSRNAMHRVKAKINQSVDDALKELSGRADPFIDWQMSKSTGHCFTEEGKGSIKLYSCHADQ